MQSHDDYDANLAHDLTRKLAEAFPPAPDPLQKLRDEFERTARGMTERGENLITAGAPSEQEILIDKRGGFLIRQLPEDPLALRISIGEAHETRLGESAYLVYRGERGTIRTLLRRALAALEAMPR